MIKKDSNFNKKINDSTRYLKNKVINGETTTRKKYVDDILKEKQFKKEAIVGMNDDEFWNQLNSNIKESLICENLSQNKIENLISNNNEQTEELTKIISEVVDFGKIEKKELEDLKEFYRVAKVKKTQEENLSNMFMESKIKENIESEEELSEEIQPNLKKKRNRNENEDLTDTLTCNDTTKIEKYPKPIVPIDIKQKKDHILIELF